MIHLKKTFSYDHPVEEADVVLVGIPFDYTEIGAPVRYGPLFIREAIKNVVGHDPNSGVNIFEKYKFTDLGDVEVVPGNWKLTQEAILDTVKFVYEKRTPVTCFLGGDHLITLGVLESLAQFHDKITVIHFDAHRDLLPEWMGEKYSHITWANHILNNPKFELVQIGCRSWDKSEDITGVSEEIKKTDNPVYITVDMDVFDPAYAPEVGTPEPLGMKPEEFFSHLKKACENRVIGFDIVECASQKVNTNTALLAAYVFKNILINLQP